MEVILFSKKFNKNNNESKNNFFFKEIRLFINFVN